MTRSAFIHVQHLLGTGHFSRALAIGRALANKGVDVTLATGNTPPPLADLDGITLVELPPVRAKDARFKSFLTPEGKEIDDAWKAKRTEATLTAFGARDFDLLLTETWPFGAAPLRLRDGASRRSCPRPGQAARDRGLCARYSRAQAGGLEGRGNGGARRSRL